MTTTNPTPTPTPNPYAPITVKPVIQQGVPGAAIPAPVMSKPDFASQNAAAAAAHNRLVLANSGARVGGSKSKSKRTKSKRSKSKRSKSKRTKSKRKRSARQKRGGVSFMPTTTTPTPTPTVKAVTVPQFSGSASASAASVGGNHLAMTGAAQAALDDTNAPPTYTKLV
jgi:hypothetical protein